MNAPHTISRTAEEQEGGEETEIFPKMFKHLLHGCLTYKYIILDYRVHKNVRGTAKEERRKNGRSLCHSTDHSNCNCKALISYAHDYKHAQMQAETQTMAGAHRGNGQKQTENTGQSSGSQEVRGQSRKDRTF